MSLPGITHHNPESKSHQHAAQDLSSLQRGTRFAKDGVVLEKLDPTWMAKFQIPSVFPHKKWSDEEVLDIFLEISKWLFTLSTDVRKVVSKDVPSLIYNPRSGKSQFLKMACTKAEEAMGIKPKQNDLINTDTPEGYYHDKLVSTVKKYRSTSTVPLNESKHLLEVATKLLALQKKTRLKVPEAIPVRLLDEYCDYLLKNQRVDGVVSVYQIGPGTRDWDAFWRTRGYDEF
jgi:hypothetical protein